MKRPLLREFRSFVAIRVSLLKPRAVATTKSPRKSKPSRSKRTVRQHRRSLGLHPDDLQRFLQFHADKGRVGKRQIAPASVLAELYQKQPATKDYGIGFKLLRDGIVGHGGATGTFASVDLETSRILIVFTQAGSANARPLLAGATKVVLP